MRTHAHTLRFFKDGIFLDIHVHGLQLRASRRKSSRENVMQGAPRLGEKIEFYHFYIETSDYHTTNRKADLKKKKTLIPLPPTSFFHLISLYPLWGRVQFPDTRPNEPHSVPSRPGELTRCPAFVQLLNIWTCFWVVPQRDILVDLTECVVAIMQLLQ